MKRIKYLQCLLVPWLTACSSLPTPPIKVPFAPYQKGAKLETSFRVTRATSYDFFLSYPVRSGDPFNKVNIVKKDKASEIMAIPVRVQFKLWLLNPDKTETLIKNEIKTIKKADGGGALLIKIFCV